MDPIVKKCLKSYLVAKKYYNDDIDKSYQYFKQCKILLEQLKKYTNPQKSYYEKNKEVINEKAKERLKKIAEENPNKIKEYARNAYLKKKLKKEKIT
jgi:superfamily I DNA and RNA helicase